MKNQMSNQKGFTLIELIIVIVILGILAVTAAPRFIDLQSDARAKTLQGVKAALQGASQLVYAKAAIAGQQNSATVVSTALSSTVSVSTINGYPDAETVTDLSTAALRSAEVAKFLDLSTGDFLVTEPTTPTTPVSFLITFSNQTETNNCYISYSTAAAGAAPAISVVDTGC